MMEMRCAPLIPWWESCRRLAPRGIKTLVMGISSPLTTISDAVLQAFANAGAKQPVCRPFATRQHPNLKRFYDECQLRCRVESGLRG